MGPPPTTSQWKCRVCAFERYHQVSVRRKDGSLYVTGFYACSQCSGMFLNPQQWNGLVGQGHQPGVNVEAPPDVITPMRRRR
jgi:hypothetical protein